MPLHVEAWRVYLDRFGLTVDDIAGRMHGKHNNDLVADFFGPALTGDEMFGHGAAKESLYREMMAERLQASLVPGVAAFLERHDDLPKAVGSNAEPANVNFVLDGANLRRYFQVIVDGMQVERPKPYPDVYLRAADLLNVDPRQCVVFEDSPAGVAAARDAGARVVGVETHGRLDGVDLRVPHFLDPALDRWLAEVRG
jgi:HAD superfamily hydrolase (TIGR01509 family)